MRKAPTKHQIEHAKRKVIVFIQGLINDSSLHYSGALPMTCSNSMFINPFPNELWERNIIIYFSGATLLAFSQTCKLGYMITLQSELWNYLIIKKIKKLNLPINLGSLKAGKKTYLDIKPVIKPIQELDALLSMIQTVPDNILRVQSIFKRLRLDSPWTPNIKERFRTDIQKFIYPEDVIIEMVSTRSAKLRLEPKTGFYKDECINFVLDACEYPGGPPIAHMVSPSIYHPLVRPCGRVDNPLSFIDNWKTHYHTVSDVVLELLNLFIDSKFLTENFTL